MDRLTSLERRIATLNDRVIRMTRCLKAFDLEQRGEATRAQVLDVCRKVTAADMRNE